MKNKYNAKKVDYHGITFDSRAEARRFQQLKDQLAAGAIRNLELQPRYVILPSYKRGGRTVRKTEYVADFRYQTPDGKTIVEDVKSPITAKNPVYRLKKKMFEYKYPDVIFREVMS